MRLDIQFGTTDIWTEVECINVALKYAWVNVMYAIRLKFGYIEFTWAYINFKPDERTKKCWISPFEKYASVGIFDVIFSDYVKCLCSESINHALINIQWDFRFLHMYKKQSFF